MLTSNERNIIERAYELAQEMTDISEIRRALKAEGYSQVEEHLAGKQIREDLARIINEPR